MSADADGEGKDDLLLLRESWGFVRRNSDQVIEPMPWSSLSFGEAAVFGYYNGDGRDEPAVWHAANATWDILFRQTPR